MANNSALVIPPELRSHFTDAQAEELVAQFEQSDADSSGAIDEHEFHALLARMSLSVTDAEAGELVASIDTNGNGLIDFTELVMMVVQLKKGDARFEALKRLLESLEATPVAVLEREAKKFGLRVDYQLIHERKPTSSTPAEFVMELVLSGKWCGGARGTESLQAVGKTTREAKFKAAEAGLARVKKLKPGLAFELGHVPLEWTQWLFENLERGSKARTLLETLTQKGFAPAHSLTLMQRVSTRVSSYKLRTRRSAPTSMYEAAEKNRTSTSSNSSDDAIKPRGASTTNHHHVLHPKWAHWSHQELERGIDGRVVLDELVTFGYDAAKSPLFTQQLLRAATASLSSNASKRTESDSRIASTRIPSASASAGAAGHPEPRRFTFVKCLEDGLVRDVELFVSAGQDVNASVAVADAHYAPLHIACRHAHTALVRLLLTHGAAVDQRDDFDRTPLLVAARAGALACCELLLQHHASLYCVDKLRNTALHMAALSGCAQLVARLLAAHDDAVLLLLASLPRSSVPSSVSYTALLHAAFDSVMTMKLRANERRRFHLAWVSDAAAWLHDQLLLAGTSSAGAGTSAVQSLPQPQQWFLDYLIEQHHDEFSPKVVDADADDANDTDAQEPDAREWISFDEVAFYLDTSLRGTFKHLRNRQGRTALHVACDENLVCTHELAIQSLADHHGVSPLLRDHSGQLPANLVLASRGRPGSPRGGDVRHEQQLVLVRDERQRAKQQRLEAERIAQRRQRWRDELESLASDFDTLETRAAAQLCVKQLVAADAATAATTSVPCVAGWRIYTEPLSGNRLFENTASGFVQRQVPARVLAYWTTQLGWKEMLELTARIVECNRHAPAWELYRIHGSDRYFYANRELCVCQWRPPANADAPRSGWHTKRVLESQALIDAEDEDGNCDDDSATTRAASRAIAFSGTASVAITKDAVRGRRLGAWRECSCFGVTFYLRSDSSDGSGKDCKDGKDAEVAIAKPPDVLLHESFRFAEVLIRARSEEIEELRDGWRRYYDAVTAHTFYYDEFSGACVHDTDATARFVASIQKPKPKSRFALTKDELSRRREEQEWTAALQRARRRDDHAVAAAAAQTQQAQQSAAQSEQLAAALAQLERSVTSEHLSDVHGVGGRGRDLAYVDARFRRERDVFIDAHKHGLLVSINPTHASPHDEIDRARAFELTLDDDERESAALEDTDANHALRERRRVSRGLYRVTERLRRNLTLCRWGCNCWFPRVRSLETHERTECTRRRMCCRLGCGLVLEHANWQRVIYDHESEFATACDARMVACSRDCGVWLPHIELAHHMHALCVKRPVGDLLCRLGCGRVYQGGAHELLALEQTRLAHEQDDCVLRKVECTWPACRAVILARDRNAHRRDHITASGVVSFVTAEVHAYRVPKGMKLLKVQAWGAGGGSGHLKGEFVGHGGGGAFVEGVCRVSPGETLYLSIGAGGCAGKYARLRQIESSDDSVDSIDSVAVASPESTATTPKKPRRRIETFVGVAKGGLPGGGDGHSGNKLCACGGGGGFTSVYREGAFGTEYLLIAGGGGGGGTCRDGDGGGGCRARAFTDGDDVRMGQPGGESAGGAAGECDAFNPICKFVGTDGASMQGGNGAEFGGGGGSGVFGGGGGGFAPGIAGGGGGGSSFVNTALFERKSVQVEPGSAVRPGGMRENPPQSVRGAYWDIVDAVAGEGGTSTLTTVARGNHGAVRLARLGFFDDMKLHR